ncbi:MAG TPA: bacteriocin [Mucilaginibacter sp.]|nr:bacteriocin [Mucilaginibacter sp.]
MKKQLKSMGKLSLQKELTKSELKQIVGGYSGTQTYCSGGGSGPFPVAGSTPIGCQPAYCSAAGHGTFLYCA